MISTRTVNIYGYISIGVMLLLLALVWFEVVPKTLYVPFFLVAVVLFLGRLVLRILVVQELRRKNKEQMHTDN